MDSTLRGNLVADVDTALDAVGGDLALVAPTSPRNGRTTVEGYHLVDGVPTVEALGGTMARLWHDHSAGPFRSGFA